MFDFEQRIALSTFLGNQLFMNDSSERPPKVEPKVIGAPKIRQLYWCDFPRDAQLPEFWKLRPVVILSGRNTLHGCATVIPCSTMAQGSNKWAYPLGTTIDGRAAWAICDKLTTVAVSRLSPDRNGIKRLPVDEFEDMLKIVLEWLPKLPTV